MQAAGRSGQLPAHLALLAAARGLCAVVRARPRTSALAPTLRPAQVSYVKGWGSLKSANEVEVSLLDGGKASLPTKNVLIATGSEVTPLPGVPVDEER